MAAVAKQKQGSPRRITTGGIKKTFDEMADDSKVEIVVEGKRGKQNEYLVEAADPRHDVMQRRKAYDAHLKTDILYSGRAGSMNATFDPFNYGHYGHGYGWGHGYNYPYAWRPPMNKTNEYLGNS